MKLVTADMMRELEEISFSEYGVSSLVMMENAAQGFCEKLESETGSVCGKKINIFCGRGNNGGDGFAIARLLSVRGANVTVFIAFNPDELKKDARTNYELAVKFGISISEFTGLTGDCDIVIDALYGIGFHGDIEGEELEMVNKINSSGAFVASVDMPSGASANDGSVAKTCVKADLTVTFGAAKIGQFLYPAKKRVGKLVVSEISIPNDVLNSYDSKLFVLDESIEAFLPEREENSHKGSFGKVLAFCGSKGMCGAAVMASEAILKSGAGMATLATPKCISDIAAQKLTEVMTLSLPSDDGESVSKTAFAILKEKLSKQDILLCGCGLGTGDGVKETVTKLVSESKKPMIIDADAINALATNINVLKKKNAPAILTPHMVEFSRISGRSVEDICKNRIGTARDFARKFDVTVVLKNADTIIACPDGRVFINAVSNSGMATAGSGDVLSGIIAGLAAQGLDASMSACLGVYIHSLAGQIARQKLVEYSMTALDILNAVPFAFMKIKK
ncbi:MAG: NAD(P)H-hydrate dehydratase [Clostridia bacterium]|nr:NAD(P)H-hydrate dehydratase [Clostridia bacterium]